MSEATIYNSKAELEVSEAGSLRELESENAKLEQMLADAMPGKVALTRRAA